MKHFSICRLKLFLLKDNYYILSFLEQTPFKKGLDVGKSRQEVTKVVSLKKMEESLQSVFSPLTQDNVKILGHIVLIRPLHIQLISD